MKISEMERHYDVYLKLANEISQLGKNGEITNMLKKCVEAFPHIDPLLQLYKRRNLGPIPDLAPIDTICDYAPLFFEHEKLTTLSDFVNSTRRLAKYSQKNFSKQVDLAIKKEMIAWKLWNYLEANPNCDEIDLYKKLKVKQDYLVWIIERWASFGLIVREKLFNSFKIKLATNLEEEIVGICIACGAKGKGKKITFLETEECPKCKNKGRFHLSIGQEASNIREV